MKELVNSSDMIAGPFIKQFQKIIDKLNDDNGRYLSNDGKIPNIDNEMKDLLSISNKLDPKYVPYASISNIVYKTNRDSDSILPISSYVTILNSSLLNIVENDSDENISIDSLVFVLKAIEHFNLACSQAEDLYNRQNNAINKINDEIDDYLKKNESLSKKLNVLSDKSDEVEESINEIKNIKGSIYADFIGILGIFASIIVAMFGGLSAISSSIKAITNEKLRIYSVLMTSSLFSIVLTFIVFMLLVAISKLTGKNIKSCGHVDHCNCKFRKKYPIFFWSIIILMLLFFAFWGISSLTHRY